MNINLLIIFFYVYILFVIKNIFRTHFYSQLINACGKRQLIEFVEITSFRYFRFVYILTYL